MMKRIRVATRRSQLALYQAEQAIAALKPALPGYDFELVEILSDGCYDKFKGNLQEIGGKGVFVKSLQQQVLTHEVDLAVHSMKDVPTDEDMPAPLTIAAVLPRADARDVLISPKQAQTVADLPIGARVGTSSVRRAAQLWHMRPDLIIQPLRGNVPTRLEKLANGEADAIMLAAAGLLRLNLLDATNMTALDLATMLPAAGQGIIGLECRRDDARLLAALAQINHVPSWQALQAERAMLEHLHGSCHTPIAAHCEVMGTQLHLTGLVASSDGQQILRASANGIGPSQLGKAVAEDLLQQGARQILNASAQASTQNSALAG